MSAFTAHFVITGEFITRQARAFWGEKDQQTRALELLQCMDGLTEGQQLDILEGRAKLVGDSNTGVTLEADTASMPTLHDVLRKLRAERDAALEDTADLMQMYNGDTVGVASPTGLRTVPIRQTRVGKGGRRQLRDGLDWEDTESPEGAQPRIYRETEPSPQRRAERIIMESMEPQIRPVPVPEDKITSDNGWLSPDGKFYGCRYGGHNQLVDDLELDPETMDKEHWIKLQGRDGEQHIFPRDYDNIPFVQKEKIAAYCAEKNIEVPWWAKEKIK